MNVLQHLRAITHDTHFRAWYATFFVINNIGYDKYMTFRSIPHLTDNMNFYCYSASFINVSVMVYATKRNSSGHSTLKRNDIEKIFVFQSQNEASVFRSFYLTSLVLYVLKFLNKNNFQSKFEQIGRLYIFIYFYDFLNTSTIFNIHTFLEEKNNFSYESLLLDYLNT